MLSQPCILLRLPEESIHFLCMFEHLELPSALRRTIHKYRRLELPVDAPLSCPFKKKKKKNYSWWPCASKLYYLCALLPTRWLVYCNFIKMVSKPAHRHMVVCWVILHSRHTWHKMRIRVVNATDFHSRPLSSD